jgi:hypothetical protein
MTTSANVPTYSIVVGYMASVNFENMADVIQISSYQHTRPYTLRELCVCAEIYSSFLTTTVRAAAAAATTAAAMDRLIRLRQLTTRDADGTQRGKNFPVNWSQTCLGPHLRTSRHRRGTKNRYRLIANLFNWIQMPATRSTVTSMNIVIDRTLR